MLFTLNKQEIQLWLIRPCNYNFLFQVKSPTTCPNQHVFCSSCMDVWLERNQQCPACRVAITAENPCKKILGMSHDKA